MTIPLEEGFTVVTGPNGSGKSNILDGVLFCLGLATSRGMRADRLPDLVNSGILKAGKSAETVVSVKFDLSDWSPDLAEEGLEQAQEGPWIKSGQKEWTVTRRLKVMPGGSYSSSYAADGETCTLQQLQTQLRRLRIDPEGSNVVMQGDVTRIVSMSNKDRRGLIDELAGVALFDNRIEQTRLKLDTVHERQERCRIVEQELLAARHRLERDCAKARIYKELKIQFQLGKQQELVLSYESAKQGLFDLDAKRKSMILQESRDIASLAKQEENLSNSLGKLKTLQENVKALGEDKLLRVQSELAGLDTQFRELDRQANINKTEGENLQSQRQSLIKRRHEIKEEIFQKSQNCKDNLLVEAEQACKDAEASVEVSRRRLGEVAGRSGAWIEDQRARSMLRQKLHNNVKPLQSELQKLEERLLQIEMREKELAEEEKQDLIQNKELSDHLNVREKDCQQVLEDIIQKKTCISQLVDELAVQQRTRSRLEQEQTKLENQVARLESRKEALQETRGTSALRLLLEAGLEGIHGLVAHLGEVEDSHRLALEVAAGSRLGHVVVDDDQIAAKAIHLLKLKKAGRLTFLPLNKMNSSLVRRKNVFQRGPSVPVTTDGKALIGRAVDLISCDPIYSDVFAHVFGETLVFADLCSARAQLGYQRAVTLDGELLEKSGAMTGGSFSGRGIGFSFGSSQERDEIEPIRKRLLEVGETLVSCKRKQAQLSQELDNLTPVLRSLEQRKATLEAEQTAAEISNKPLLQRHHDRVERIQELSKTKNQYHFRSEELRKELKPLLLQLEQLEGQESFADNQDSSESWKLLQKNLEDADSVLVETRRQRDELLSLQAERTHALERLEDQQKVLEGEEKRLQESVKSLARAHHDWKSQQTKMEEQRRQLEKNQKDLQSRFGEQRLARDEAEAQLAKDRQEVQEAKWNLDRLREELVSLAEELRSGRNRLDELEKALPDPLPEISDEIRSAGLTVLQSQLEAIQAKMEALEPVNMLALEELDELNKRLGELVERLDTLTEERSELLLRIETVATLRQEAFMEAFEAVDKHFREIFASLSEGDGHLQLDNEADPLEGGLTLVAHPKGKTVRRLAAMSGGEKSLTALSFLFALQRFRPSPFYALDEVDSFLDGVNVERLSSLIARQAEQAQFLVVSHRRPMIGASNRTIGVTQARGFHTQVIGLPDAA